MKLGKGGIKEIIEVDLNEEERKMFDHSKDAVRGVMDVLDGMKFF